MMAQKSKGLFAGSVRWTGRLQLALQEVRRLERTFVPGRDPSSPLDTAKVALADALLMAVTHTAQDRLARIRAPPVHVTAVRPRRRKQRSA
jgi:hypothetical protein